MGKGKSAERAAASALDGSPSHLLHRAVQVALDIYAEELGPGALTQRQYALLLACAEHEGATQTELVRITGIDRSTLADMAVRMIAKGLLERERSAADGRANAVRLTEAGRQALEAARPRMAAADARLLKLISGKSRRETIVELLTSLIEGARKAQAKGGARKRPKLELVAGSADDPPVRRRKKARKAA